MRTPILKQKVKTAYTNDNENFSSVFITKNINKKEKNELGK